MTIGPTAETTAPATADESMHAEWPTEAIIGPLPHVPGRSMAQRLRDRQMLSRRVAVTRLAAGLLGGTAWWMATNGGPASLGMALGTTVTVLVLFGAGQVRRHLSLAACIGALILCAFLPFRSSPWLVSLDLVMIGVLVLAAAAYNSGGAVWSPLSTISRRVLTAVPGLLLGVSEAATAIASILPSHLDCSQRRRETVRSIGRGAVFGLPLILIVAMLFSAADPLFASLFRFPTISMDWPDELTSVTVGAIAMLGLLRLTRTKRADPLLPRSFETNEVITVMAGFVVVYALFAATQIAAVLGGSAYVVERTAGSYRRYARSGFFQLLIASAITLAVLFSVRGALHRARGRSAAVITTLCVILCGLSIAVVASSIHRIHLYSAEYGQTMLRLYSTTFAVWLGVVFLMLGIAAVVGSMRVSQGLRGSGEVRDSMGVQAVLLAFVGLVGMNIFNPEAFVAHSNLRRAVQHGEIEVALYRRVSGDSVPAIISEVGQFPPELRTRATSELCPVLKHRFSSRRRAGSSIFPSFAYNRSEHRAAKLVTALCQGH